MLDRKPISSLEGTWKRRLVEVDWSSVLPVLSKKSQACVALGRLGVLNEKPAVAIYHGDPESIVAPPEVGQWQAIRATIIVLPRVGIPLETLSQREACGGTY